MFISAALLLASEESARVPLQCLHSLNRFDLAATAAGCWCSVFLAHGYDVVD